MTAKQTSFKSDTIIWGASFVAERAISFSILPLITKTLGQESYGIWTQIIITSSIASVLLSLGFNTTLVRFAAGKDKTKISGIFHRMLAVVLASLTCFLVILFLFAEKASIAIFGNARFVDFVFVLGFFVVAEALFELVGVSMLRTMEFIRHCSIYNITRYAIRAGILFFGVFYFRSLWTSLAFVIVAQLLLLSLIYYKDIFRNIGFSFFVSGREWHAIVNFSIPLFFYGILTLLMLQSNRYIIVHFLNIEHLSIYAVHYSIAGIVGVLYSVLGFTLYPRMASLWNSGNVVGASEVFGKSISYYIFFTIPIVTVLTMLNSPIVMLLATQEYLAGYSLMLCLSLSIALFGMYQLHFYIMLFQKKMLFNSVIMFLSFLIMAIFSIFLIQAYGVVGPALALLLANAFHSYLTIKEARKILSYKFHWLHAGKNIFAAILVVVTIIVSGTLFDLFNIYNLLFAFVIAGLIYFGADLLSKKSMLKELARGL